MTPGQLSGHPVWGEEQWAAFCALAAAGWPGEFPDADRKAWRILLDAIDPALAVEALKRLLYSGRRFYPRPAVSDLLAELRVDSSRPTFDEAFLLIRRSLKVRPGRVVFATVGEMHAAEDREALSVLEGCHPLVHSFAARQGVRRLRSLPFNDPEWGEKARRDLQAAWDRHVESWDGREVAVLASGQGLRQLDPGATLALAVGK